MMKKIIFLSSLFNVCAIHNIYAQATSSASQSATLNLSNAIAITFVSSGTTTGNAANVTFTSVSDYANGLPSADQQLKVQSNKSFNVSINANSANFTYSGATSPAPVMPITNILYVEVSANNTGGAIPSIFYNHYAPVTTSAQNILTGCLNGSNQTFSIQYFTQPGFAYPAGNYTVNVVLTATQP